MMKGYIESLINQLFTNSISTITVSQRDHMMLSNGVWNPTGKTNYVKPKLWREESQNWSCKTVSTFTNKCVTKSFIFHFWIGFLWRFSSFFIQIFLDSRSLTNRFIFFSSFCRWKTLFSLFEHKQSQAIFSFWKTNLHIITYWNRL